MSAVPPKAPRNEKGNRGTGPPAGGDHAPHLGGRHRVPLDQGTSRGSGMTPCKISFDRRTLEFH